MMLAKADEIDAETVGQHRFLDHVPDHLRVGQQLPRRIGGHVAERIQSHFEQGSLRRGSTARRIGRSAYLGAFSARASSRSFTAT